jgi:translation initiation factor IF-3
LLTFSFEQIFYRRNKTINQLLNDEINLPQVRLVGEDGEQLGLMSSAEANKIADDKNLDLVLISPQATPPVCKIMNYGKFKFEQTKRQKEQRKAQKIVELKEVQLSMTIQTHDMETKSKHANRFLLEGNKVKVAIRMKGRQQAKPELGLVVMKKFFEMVKENAVIEKTPEILGKNITMVLASTVKK